ncbi:hypothetical protein CK203_092459 [Vitis vinifera]|uniref:Uncharacterized protein n=1 Tax=Vitis vinifera TaxID=29760 RepID=A0A438DYB2_VITVI|nr:hypothetical protein CK203_092459 [Vitis vinifera]
MDDLFRWADKYVMLEDDVRAASQQVLGTFIDDNVRPIDEPIAFSPIDSNRVILPHEDVLVLTLGVGGFDVHIILIDLGSFVNLLQMSAYRQMGYSLSALENPGRILTSFNGASTVSLGDDILTVQVDPITLNVLFSIVEDLSPYNVIMG